MIKTIDARIKRFLGGIRLTFRGVVTLVKAAGAVQLVQLEGLSGESIQDAEYFQHYGVYRKRSRGTGWWPYRSDCGSGWHLVSGLPVHRAFGRCRTRLCNRTGAVLRRLPDAQ